MNVGTIFVAAVAHQRHSIKLSHFSAVNLSPPVPWRLIANVYFYRNAHFLSIDFGIFFCEPLFFCHQFLYSIDDISQRGQAVPQGCVFWQRMGMQQVLLRNFMILDEQGIFPGSVLLEDGLIAQVIPDASPAGSSCEAVFPGLPLDAAPAGLSLQALPPGPALIIDGFAFAPGRALVLMPALVDIHAHFREPGFLEKETLESGSLAAVAGGFGTVVCMANTDPVIDTLEAAEALRSRADALGLIDLYPALSLTRGMEGKELSDIQALLGLPAQSPFRLLSEDGKDVLDEGLFYQAFKEAQRLGLPVSCHCDAGGAAAAAAKQAGAGRAVWSRIEENVATVRAIEIGKRAGAHIHIAHVSTQEAVEHIRQAKKTMQDGWRLTCEAAPHHLALTEETAHELGDESWGRVNPPLRSGADREALIQGVLDGTIDAIATDHAPHTLADKLKGSPGFSGLETAFGVCHTVLVQQCGLGLPMLSRLMSAEPARILGLEDRGRIVEGLLADLVIADLAAPWRLDPRALKSKGRNTPYENLDLIGRILLTIHRGRVVYQAS